MEIFVPLLIEVARKYSVALISPFYLLLIIFIGWQYKRMQEAQELTVGLTGKSRRYLRTTLVAALAGILGGFLGSFLLIFFGIDLAGLGLIYIFLTAIALMMIHPRFLCFAYAGGLLSILSISVGFPQIQVAHLMGLVAILHMVESLLIIFTGYLDPIPVYLSSPGQNTIGGFNLQKFWPIPLVAMMSTEPVSTSLGIDNWWAILNNPYIFNEITYSLMPVLAILGYGEVTTTSLPVHRSKSSAFYLALYSVILLGLAVLGSYRPSLLILAALFGPLGHEMVIFIGWYSERYRTPIYTPPEKGVMVLDVIHQSPAAAAGLRSLDIIIEINGRPVDNLADLALETPPSRDWFKVTIIRSGQRRVLSVWKHDDHLGIIPVPEGKSHSEEAARPKSSLIRTLWSYLKKAAKP